MSRCVEYNQKPDELTRLLANRQRTLLNLMHVTSSDAFASSLFGVAAPFGFGVYSGDLWIKYAHTEELNPICRAPACGHVCEERAADPVQGCAESNWPRGPAKGPLTKATEPGQFLHGDQPRPRKRWPIPSSRRSNALLLACSGRCTLPGLTGSARRSPGHRTFHSRSTHGRW
jgi:hypothetical protein